MYLCTEIVAVMVILLHGQRARAIFGIPDFLETGICANVSIMETLDPVKFQGLWFDIRTVPNEYVDAAKCVSQNYTWTGSAINVLSEGITEEGTATSQVAVMTPESSEDDPDDLNYAFMTVETDGMPNAPFKVMWTDYVTTACIYSCLDYYSMFRAEFAWVLSRFPTPKAFSYRKCIKLFKSENIDVKKIVFVQQGELCKYSETVKAEQTRTRQFVSQLRGNMNRRLEGSSDLTANSFQTHDIKSDVTEEDYYYDIFTETNSNPDTSTSTTLMENTGLQLTGGTWPMKILLLCVILFILS